MSAQKWIDARAKFLLVLCRPHLERPAARSARSLAEYAARAHERSLGADATRWPSAVS